MTVKAKVLQRARILFGLVYAELKSELSPYRRDKLMEELELVALEEKIEYKED